MNQNDRASKEDIHVYLLRKRGEYNKRIYPFEKVKHLLELVLIQCFFFFLLQKFKEDSKLSETKTTYFFCIFALAFKID